MSRVQVREARPGDDGAVGELLVRAFVETYARKLPDVVVTEGRKRTLRDVAGKRVVARVRVAEVGGVLAGTVALWPPGAAGSEAWLSGAADLRHLAVDERFRDGAVSKALLDDTEVLAVSLGASDVCLHVRRGAHGVRRLYEERGYVRDPAGDIDRLPEIFLEALRKPLGRPAAQTVLTGVRIDTGTLADRVVSSGRGAVVTFEGVVRGEEAGEPIDAIVYEAYAPMAEREIGRIVAEARRRWAGGVEVAHRIGRVPVGEASLVVVCACRHRKDAFEAAAWVVDRIKELAPIWKTAFEKRGA